MTDERLEDPHDEGSHANKPPQTGDVDRQENGDAALPQADGAPTRAPKCQ
jgi:hypothetical protein